MRAGATAVAGAFFLLGCAKPPSVWMRTDGLPIASQTLAADQAVCQGEANKANLAAGRSAALHPDAWGYSDAMLAVYRGCMADRGYLPAGR